MGTSARGVGPLSHLRVLDLTQFLAGPYASLLMADLGAEVIKIESPDGDLTRMLPPHFVDGESAYFLSANRNKKSVVVDLKTPDGQEIVRGLVRSCDIVLENFRPGVAKRLGLDHAVLRESEPRLIWCSISGFGQDGPFADLPAYDMVVQALSGSMSITGESDGESVRTGIPLSDLAAGMFAVIGTLAAVAERERCGEGQYIDISMLDCQISMLSYQAAYYLVSGEVPMQQGRGHISIPTYRAFRAGDGEDIVVTANTEPMWRAMCHVLGVDELIDDPRFRTNADRHKHRTELWKIVESRFLAEPAARWLEQFRMAGVPAATVNTVEGALRSPQVRHRGMVLPIRAPGGTQIDFVGNPIKMSRPFPPESYTYPPSLGEHTEQLLGELLGYSDENISRLRESGVLGRAGASSAQEAL